MKALTPAQRLLRRLVAAIAWPLRNSITPLVHTRSSTAAAIEVARCAVNLLWLSQETDARVIRRVILDMLHHRVRHGWIMCHHIGKAVQNAAQAYAALAPAGGVS